MSDCPFCNFEGPVIQDHKDCVIFKPLDPVVPGHVLVVPKVHVQRAWDEPVYAARCAAIAALYARAHVGPCNIIINVGEEASQTVFHLHVHVVPRRKGDGLKLPWSK